MPSSIRQLLDSLPSSTSSGLPGASSGTGVQALGAAPVPYSRWSSVGRRPTDAPAARPVHPPPRAMANDRSEDSYCTTNDTGTQWNNSVFLWKKYRLRVQYTCTVHISILNVKYLHADFREFLKVPTVPLSS